MTPNFLLSVCNSHRVIYNKKLNVEKIYKRLKPREVNTLIEMCNELKKASPKLSIFDGYFVGYVIPQISNEFDLLRFSDDLVINIEIKSPLSDDVKLDKITTQMKKNMYTPAAYPPQEMLISLQLSPSARQSWARTASSGKRV